MPTITSVAIRMLLLSFGLAAYAPLAFSQECDATLEGHITSAGADWPLAYADILIRSTGLRTQTDAAGHFHIQNLCKTQAYTLEIHYLSRRIQVRTQPGMAHIDIEFPADTSLQEVVVSAKTVTVAHTETICIADRLDFSSKQGVNLAEVVRQLPGVTTLQTGANIAKPVIQGLHSNRIAIVNNDIVLESQQWGREHAPEIDPFSANKVSVVKGAQGVRYGVGAMGGAVVLEPEPLRVSPGVGGWASAGVFTNGRSGYMASAVDYRSKNEKFGIRLQETVKRGGNMRAPDYFLYNTGHQEFNVSALAEWKPSFRTRHEFSFSRIDQKMGVLKASHLGNAEQIIAASQLDTPLNNINQFTWAIQRPYQSIQHYTAKYKLNFRPGDFWKITGIFSHQFNNRREYDVVRKTGAAADKAQVSFRLWTNTLDVQTEYLGSKYWRGEAGVQLTQATNYVNKGAFIPDYTSWGTSAWAHERWHRYNVPWEWEIGARYDLRFTHATTIGNGSRNLDENIRFGNFSGVTGLHYHIGAYSTLTVHTGLAWRPPSVYELFAQGVHQGAGIYEQGDSTMVSEKAWNSNLTFNYTAPGNSKWSFNITAYRNQIRDFIYLDPQNTVRVTIRGPFPAYYYKQSDAVLQGIDAQFIAPLWGPLLLETRASVLRAHRVLQQGEIAGQTTDPLPLMPSDRIQYGLKWEKKQITARLLANTVRQQHRIPHEGLLKAPPPTFTTFSLDATYEWTKWGEQWEIGLSIQNMTNTRYREYLNFFRFYADEPGVNAGIRIKCTF